MMKTAIESVSPERAAQFLKQNVNNRPLRKNTVSRYAELMRRGAWLTSPEPIIFDFNGELINGQHRLAAVVESGCTVQLTVTRGVDPETFKVIDSGVNRTMADRLHQVDVPHPAIASTAVKYYLWYKIDPRLRWSGGPNVAHKFQVTTDDVIKVVRAIGYDVVGEAGSIAIKVNKETRLPRPSVATAYLLFKEADPMDLFVSKFFEGLITGVNLRPDDPRLTLRRTALNSPVATGRSQRMVVALIKAWNAYVRGRSLGVIKWLPTEPMPQVQQVLPAEVPDFMPLGVEP